MNVEKFIIRVCKDHKKKIDRLVFIRKKDANRWTNPTDGSFVAWRDIYIGIYRNPELKLISFFHEMGHILQLSWRVTHSLKIDNERIAWEKGLALAKRYGIKFSRKALQWARKELNSYRGWEEREVYKYHPPNTCIRI